MTKLYLTSCFHGNLMSSNIPESQYPRILDKCYWPVLDLVDKIPGLRLGIEFPALSLIEIDKIDSSFIKKIKELEAKEKIELVASGYVQAIQPLLPYEVNKANLLMGNALYEKLIGRIPRLAYLNEQTVSDKTHELYLEAGLQAFIMEFENCRLAAGLPADFLYYVQKVKNSDLKVLWNSSIAFQRFQRYMYGLINRQEYIDYLGTHCPVKGSRVFMFYGSDWEIIDYKPGDIDLNYVDSTNEIKRLEELFLQICEDKRFEFLCPSKALNSLPVRSSVDLTSADYPIPTKKQSKYNVVRWAVCGRDNSRSNTLCYQLYDSLKKISAMEGHPINKQEMQVLLELFASDYRTFTTDEKYQEFQKKIGAFSDSVKEHLQSVAVLSKTPERTLFNPLSFDWNRYPFSFVQTFEQGQFTEIPEVFGEYSSIPSQFEDIEYYRDGSIRSARVVITPLMSAGQKFMLTYRKAGSQKQVDIQPTAVLVLNEKKGGIIKSLTFPGIDKDPLMGEIAHHHYNDIRVSTDQFSGHMLVFNKNGQKIVDLSKPEEIIRPQTENPIRDKVLVKINTAGGSIWKTYYIYKKFARVDLAYHFRFNDLAPLSFRLGTVTLMPDTFDAETLHFQTVNGTSSVEVHMLDKKYVDHGAPVSLDVSSHCCLGATEGWISVGDNEKSLAIITNKSELYSVPMVEYKEISNRPYLRVYHSIAESDATSQPFWRGHNHMSFTYLGHKNDINEVRRQAAAINHGLVVY